ncbi:MAG: beta-lactamase family protein [Anaerolineaceae bacterium]|nr:beta-lactamase family protein [Anaerolineaceae bacterium]
MTKFPYEDPVDPEIVNIDKDKLDRVVSKFIDQQKGGAFPGGQLVLRRNGKLVLNEVCGVARGFRRNEGISPIKVMPDTPFPALSAGKPLAAIAVALLEERGLLDIEAPIAEIIPEFARYGKEQITTLDVLTHQSGIQLPDLIEKPKLWQDREAVLSHIIEAKPAYKRGTLAYAAYEYGWILSEIFLRVAGRRLSDFVAEEISDPLELPALKYGLSGREYSDLAFSYWLGKDRVMVSGINVAEDFEGSNNSVEQINSMNPAVSMVTDAASLAAFYEFLLNNGVTSSGKQVISKKVLQKYTTRNVSGLDRSSNFYSTLGRGFMLGSPFFSVYGWGNTGNCFGHAGGFSSLAFGDYETNIAVGIVTNGNRNFWDLAKRFIPLSHGLRKACN